MLTKRRATALVDQITDEQLSLFVWWVQLNPEVANDPHVARRVLAAYLWGGE